MSRKDFSRRTFLISSATVLAGGELLGNTYPALAQTGMRTGDIPDLTIKEVKVYVIDRSQIASVVTNSGIEGNYTLGGRYWHPNWSNAGWLDYAKRVLVGRNALDIAKITSQWVPSERRVGQSSYASAIDNCLWDTIGKAVGLPIYKILGAYQEKVLAYASTQHMKSVENFVDLAVECKNKGFKAYKIHPGTPQTINGYKHDIEIIKAVREAVGDDYLLLHDPVGVYNRFEAIKVGRVLDEYNYCAYEDPIPTTDIDGYIELRQMLDVPIHMGEFIFTIYDYMEYIRRDAVDVVRFIVDNIGGITGGMKVSHMAECCGLEVVPHNWGTIFDHAVHFHCELAAPNSPFFEMTQQTRDGKSATTVVSSPYIKDSITVAEDGYVYAPTKPGLGYEIDRDKLEDMLTRVDT